MLLISTNREIMAPTKAKIFAAIFSFPFSVSYSYTFTPSKPGITKYIIEPATPIFYFNDF